MGLLMRSPKKHSAHHHCFMCVISFAHQLLFSYAKKKEIKQPCPISHCVSRQLTICLYLFSVSFLHAQAKYTVNRNRGNLLCLQGIVSPETLGILKNFPDN